MRKASRRASEEGLGRNTSRACAKRSTGEQPISRCGLRLYSISSHAWVTSLRNSSVSSGTPSSISIRRPSRVAQKHSCLPFWNGQTQGTRFELHWTLSRISVNLGFRFVAACRLAASTGSHRSRRRVMRTSQTGGPRLHRASRRAARSTSPNCGRRCHRKRSGKL